MTRIRGILFLSVAILWLALANSAQTFQGRPLFPADPRPCTISPGYTAWLQYRFLDFDFCVPANYLIKPGVGETYYMGYVSGNDYLNVGLWIDEPIDSRVDNVVREDIREHKYESREGGMLVRRRDYEVEPYPEFRYAFWYTARFRPETSKVGFYVTIGSVSEKGDIPEKIFKSVVYSPPEHPHP